MPAVACHCDRGTWPADRETPHHQLFGYESDRKREKEREKDEEGEGGGERGEGGRERGKGNTSEG